MRMLKSKAGWRGFCPGGCGHVADSRSPMTPVSRMSSSLSLELGSCDPAIPAPPPRQRGTKQRKVIPIGRRTQTQSVYIMM